MQFNESRQPSSSGIVRGVVTLLAGSAVTVFLLLSPPIAPEKVGAPGHVASAESTITEEGNFSIAGSAVAASAADAAALRERLAALDAQTLQERMAAADASRAVGYTDPSPDGEFLPVISVQP